MWIHRGFGLGPQKSGGDCRAACKRLTLPTELELRKIYGIALINT